MSKTPDNHSQRHSARHPAPRQVAGRHASSAHANEHALITRRRLLYGALGVGAAAAVGIGAAAYNAAAGGNDDAPDVLDVPESSLFTLNDFEALDGAEGQVRLKGSFDIPYGTLVWANDDRLAACLLPTESGSPLAQVGLLQLGSGSLQTILAAAVGAADGYEIYDVRANGAGVVWTEANILQGTWKVYGAPLMEGNALGTMRLLEEGGDSFDTPTLAVAGSQAFWQVLPKTANTDGLGARLMTASFADDEPHCVFESARRMCTPVYGGADSVVITPRIDLSAVFYQLTRINAEHGTVDATLTLPQGMKPFEAGYGQTGFMFSFANIYNYGGGIANLGTYAPMSLPTGGDYSAERWFGFARTPSAPPAWAGKWLIVRSSYAVCGIDLTAGAYFAIEVENGADTYGEYLASTGIHDTFVTYTNIDHSPIGGERIHTCRVKVWEPVA